ncbi:MAG: alpha/beta fold hydrolase [Sphingopyxis granuli]
MTASATPATDPRIAECLSLSLPHGDAAYRVDLHVPAGEAPVGGWPAMLMLDGEGCFATAVEALRRMSRRPDATGTGPMILIGLSSPDRDPQDRHRERDFGARGGASDFARFVEADVIAAVAAHARLDPRRLTLLGHSLGGYHALWMLAHRPHLFAAIAAISPSIWWDPEGLRDALRNAPLGGQRVLLCVGEWEEELPPWQAARQDSDAVRNRRAERQMVARARDMAALLADRLGPANIQYRMLAEEDHASIISAAIPRALRLASAAGR